MNYQYLPFSKINSHIILIYLSLYIITLFQYNHNFFWVYFLKYILISLLIIKKCINYFFNPFQTQISIIIRHNCIWNQCIKYFSLVIQNILILLTVFQRMFWDIEQFSHMIYSLKIIWKHFKSQLKHYVLIKDDLYNLALIKTSSKNIW